MIPNPFSSWTFNGSEKDIASRFRIGISTDRDNKKRIAYIMNVGQLIFLICFHLLPDSFSAESFCDEMCAQDQNNTNNPFK